MCVNHVIVMSVVKQSIKAKTPHYKYIVGRLVALGWSEEQADSALDDLIQAKRLMEWLDCNKVGWYYLP